MSDLQFDCNDAPEPEVYEPIPVNTEAVSEIIESDFTAPNDKGTQMLKLKFQVLDGPYKGKTVNEGYCLVCPTSDKAVEIAQRKVRQICEALNMTGFAQTEELHGKPMLVKYGQDKPNDQGDIWNNVKSVKPYGDQPEKKAAKEPPVQETAAKSAPSGNKPPWQK